MSALSTVVLGAAVNATGGGSAWSVHILHDPRPIVGNAPLVEESAGTAKRTSCRRRSLRNDSPRHAVDERIEHTAPTDVLRLLQNDLGYGVHEHSPFSVKGISPSLKNFIRVRLVV